jgi:hypothetical protein
MRNDVCSPKYVLKMNIKRRIGKKLEGRSCHFSKTMAWNVGHVNILVKIADNLAETRAKYFSRNERFGRARKRMTLIRNVTGSNPDYESAVLTEILYGFPQSLQANAAIKVCYESRLPRLFPAT